MLLHDTDDVEITTAFGDELLGLHGFESCELIAELRCTLVIQIRGRFVHALGKAFGHELVTAFQKQQRRFDVACIVGFGNRPDARRAAAFYLILQTRPAAVGEIAVLAESDLKELLQLAERLSHSSCARIRPVHRTSPLARAAVKR